MNIGTTEVRDVVGDGTSFLERERAVLGDEADQFATPGDHLATTVEDAGDDDLLGGAGATDGADEISGFESSFPAIDTSNDVRADFERCSGLQQSNHFIEYGTWRHHHGHIHPSRRALSNKLSPCL